jgi:hypothetical protein
VKTKEIRVGRDAITGRFISIGTARRRRRARHSKSRH